MADVLGEQIDWYRVQDARASIEREMVSASHRIGESDLARILGEDPSVINKQLKHEERRRPSASLFIIEFVLDRHLRDVAAGQCGEVLVRPPDLTADEALRLAYAKAQGQWDKRAVAELADLISRVGKPEDTWERRARAAGWKPAGGR